MGKEIEKAANSFARRNAGDYENRKFSFECGATSEAAKSYWQKSMYSEADVIALLQELEKDLYSLYPLSSLEEWFEQNKTK